MEGENIFFLSWALWQQMTFVLGAAIMLVFLAGVVKLWWITRLLKKQEVLDEEKKARVEDMRRTGVPPKRANDIPFGIRAIQSGVEVVGIWISRPDSPSNAGGSKAAAPSVTIINLDSEKGTESSDELKILPAPKTNTTSNKPPPAPTPQPADGGTPEQPQTPSRDSPRQQGGGPNMLSEDTLRKLEGQSRQQQPYVRMSAPVLPTSNSHHHHHPHHLRGSHPHHQLSQRSSESSASASGESMDSQPRSFRTASGRSYTDSSRTSSKLYMAGRNNFRGGGGGGEGGTRAAYYSGLPLMGWQLEENNYSSSNRGDPFGTPPQHGRFSHQGEVAGREVVTPEPTFGPGDAVHVARVARRVNEGFEVLPAGTFAALRRLEEGGATSSTTEGSEGVEGGGGGRGQKKLRKKSIGPIQENGTTGQGAA